MFVKFRTTENGAVAINPGYVVYMTPGQEPGTTSIRVSTGTILHVAGDYPLVLEKMTLGSQDQGVEDEDDQY